MLNVIEQGAIYESRQAKILTLAFAKAVDELDVVYHVDHQTRDKLAQIVLSICKNRVHAGSELNTDEDARCIAITAAARLLELCALNSKSRYRTIETIV